MRNRVLLLVASMSMTAAGGLVAQNVSHFKVVLSGYEEPPAISTVGSGTFAARINASETEITWELSYSDLESVVTQSHIHFGQRAVNGGITVFLCSNLGNGPVGTQPCPPAPAIISGTITAADVSPPIPSTAAARAQGMGTGELAELIRAIRAGRTYANVHSTTFPAGEIRSQFGKDNHRDRDH